MRRHPRQPHADRTAGMTVARSALSSRSLHERDDGAERIILMRGGMWVRAMPVEQLAEARQLSPERGVPAKVSCLGRCRVRLRSGDRTFDSSSTAKKSSSIHRHERYKPCTVRHDTILVDLFVEAAGMQTGSISVGGE